MVAPRVFLDFAIDGTLLGRVVFELFNVSAQKTAENFRALCTGEKGVSPLSQHPLYYKNSIIHRSIRDFMIQGGDFTKRNGTGGESIYGAPFADEDLSRPVDEAGLLVMANKGPNTNNSQFFITLRPCPHLNGKHVVFGRVVRGFDDVVQKIGEVKTDEKDRPSVPVVIINCGELELRKPPPKRDASPESASSKNSDDEGRGRKRHKKHRHHSSSRSRSESPSRLRSRSRSAPSDSDPNNHKRHKKHRKHKDKKSRKSKHRSRSRSPSKPKDAERGGGLNGVPREETEEEYDARLEREENERIEAAKRRHLEELKRRYEEEEAKRRTSATEEGQVRFKGRGRMKYVDPELRASRGGRDRYD